jgi:hypothetical protein
MEFREGDQESGARLSQLRETVQAKNLSGETARGRKTHYSSTPSPQFSSLSIGKQTLKPGMSHAPFIV